MSLLKVPLILLALFSHQVALVRPSTPRPDEQDKANRVKGININSTVSLVTLFARLFVASILFAEAAVTYAVANPLNSWSQGILDLLYPGKTTPLPISVSPVFLLGVAFTVLGAFIRVSCFRELGRFFTYELAINDKHKLIMSGPYSIVRHPSYTGAVLVMVGLTMCEGGRGMWWSEAEIMWTKFGRVATVIWGATWGYVAVIVLRAWKEDEMLLTEFGEQWEEYAKRVPYRYVPGIL